MIEPTRRTPAGRGEGALHAMKDRVTRRYGVVLVLAAASIIFQMAADGAGPERWITIVLQAMTLVAAVRAAQTRKRGVLVASWVALAIAVISLVVLIVEGEIPEGPAAIVSGLLVGVAPAVLVGGLVRDFRGEGTVTTRTLAGVLAIYLLIGMFFAFVYGAVEAIDGGDLFVQITNATPADRLYFSFVTMCTVGYGDLTLGGNFPRTLAVLEMLFGQIYLVTVVALIVSNLGHRRQPS
ncbi:MAG: potassium channel family protein [Thermoleophilaceae bacterium]